MKATTRGTRALAAAAALLLGCDAAKPPPNVEVLELRGGAYERGLEHGKRLSSKIRSMMTLVLDSSLLPYLNRLQADIARVLLLYRDEAYGEGRFSRQLLLESGEELAKSIPAEYLEEMRGIADGAGLEFERILLLNTFVDSLMALRSIAFFLEQAAAPHLVRLEVVGAETDGADNDGDGSTDEAGEGSLEPYQPLPHAALAEIPPGARFRFTVTDPDGIDAQSVRVQLEDETFTPADGRDAVHVELAGEKGESAVVTFAPPAPLARASVQALMFQAGDRALVQEPPPAHARFMRNERVVFGVAGLGRRPHEIENRGRRDPRTQPPSIAFAARGAATPDGAPLVAHHFALLDVNASHKHAVVFIHRPHEGRAHVTLGWAGLVWGFSGMNEDGLTWTATSSDSLDNPMVGAFARELVAARLRSTGVPLGIAGRELLRTRSTASDGAAWLAGLRHTYGWNMLLADAAGDMVALEVDADVRKTGKGACSYTPDSSLPANLDSFGRRWSSTGPDDLRIGSHSRCNSDDIELEIQGQRISPQRYWSSFYYRSMRAYYILGEELQRAGGSIDPGRAQAILRVADLVDSRDSMTAAVFEPRRRALRYALGTVPATAGEFVELDLAARLGATDGGAQ